jgi:hypothetical protein
MDKTSTTSDADEAPKEISEVTRSAIVDHFSIAKVNWELLKEFDYKQKRISFSFLPMLSSVKLLGNDVRMTLSDTDKALTLIGAM